MMTRQGKLGINDVGCYADGTFGHSHARQILADLLDTYDGPETTLYALRNEPFNDFDAEDEAIEWLNDNVCDYPAQFTFSNGDLMLVNIETWND